MIRLPEPLIFEWDDGNHDKNWLKHGVSNGEAEEFFFDTHKLVAKDVVHSGDGEDRYLVLGRTAEGRLLSVIFTVRSNEVRVISARDMSKKERPLYEEGNPTPEV